MNALIRQLRYLQREDPEAPATLYINSPGGSVDSGMALYDVMQAVSCPIRTVCMGLAASGGYPEMPCRPLAAAGSFVLPKARDDSVRKAEADGLRPPWLPCSSSQAPSATCCPTAAS